MLLILYLCTLCVFQILIISLQHMLEIIIQKVYKLYKNHLIYLDSQKIHHHYLDQNQNL